MSTRKKSPLLPEENTSDSPSRCTIEVYDHEVKETNEYDNAWDKAMAEDKLNNPGTYKNKSFTFGDLMKMNKKIKKVKADATLNQEDIKRKIQVEAGRKGGQKPKMVIPILMAIVKYLEEKPSRKGNTNYQIAEGFKKKIKDSSPIIVEYAGCEWDVFFKEEKISAVPDTNHKAQHHQERAFSTFMNSYITEAKNIIKGESKYTQYVQCQNI